MATWTEGLSGALLADSRPILAGSVERCLFSNQGRRRVILGIGRIRAPFDRLGRPFAEDLERSMRPARRRRGAVLALWKRSRPTHPGFRAGHAPKKKLTHSFVDGALYSPSVHSRTVA